MILSLGSLSQAVMCLEWTSITIIASKISWILKQYKGTLCFSVSSDTPGALPSERFWWRHKEYGG